MHAYESHRLGLSEAARQESLAETFRTEAIPHIMSYWDNSGDYEKIVLTAAALLEQTSTYVRILRSRTCRRCLPAASLGWNA